MFRINEVISMEGKLFRVLALLPNELVWIVLNDDSAFPTLVGNTVIENDALTRIADPYENLAFLLPEKGSTAQIKRDQNYELIKPLVIEPLFYEPKVRSAIINKIIIDTGSTKQTLYRLIRRYWQRGQTPNALIPDFMNSGAKGKRRSTQTQKLGRPRKFTPGVGAIVDEQTEKLFRRVIDKYLLTEKQHSFAYAHRKFKMFYQAYHPNMTESEIPTNWQMMHFYKREYGQVEKIKSRSNKIEYLKDIQPLLSTANANVLGPGSRFEIDATIADIYLISDSDRKNIVGRPVVYIVIDVFSRMVVGLYIGFENPSYVAAMQALSMAMTDKIAYCKEYGIEISYEEWPVMGLPDAILADRGELLGHQIEALERNFSVRIENTSPYRGDAKGIVERNFKTLQANFKPFASGVVTGNKIKKHGGADYRLEATLTVHEFTEIIVASVLMRNNYHPLVKYDRSIDMPSDLPMTPLSIWNWGIQQRTGRMRTVAEDALKVSLLPRTKATFSELGVCIFGIYYSSQEILENGWMHRSKEVTRPKSLDAAYDPRTADYIYLFPKKNSAEYWLCRLTPRSREFAGCSFWDVWQTKDTQKSAVAVSQLVSDQKKRELEQFIESKIKVAGKLQPATNAQSNAQKISGIRKNRNDAKEREREKSAHKPTTTDNEQTADVIPITTQPDDYSFPDFVDELFEKDD
ncbi:MAG: transposase [Methylotenera sp.]|nr:DDE-type integrase/transposase/recombinase [Methylotenera sp.]HPM50487.1 DDE-type integrase/transposase/recombinase [Methylotenera sp.]